MKIEKKNSFQINVSDIGLFKIYLFIIIYFIDEYTVAMVIASVQHNFFLYIRLHRREIKIVFSWHLIGHGYIGRTHG